MPLPAPSIQAAIAGRTIMAGQTGDSIKQIQAKLNLHQSGSFDRKTLQAVLRFQAEKGCVVDGFVGPETLAALGFSAPKAMRKATAVPENASPQLIPPSPGASLTKPMTPGPIRRGDTVELTLAPRAKDAPGGHAVMRALEGKPQAVIDAALVAEFKAGNLPEHLRTLQPYVVKTKDGSEVTRWTLPDYIGVGSDADWVRTPVGVKAAEELARHLGGRLPTKEDVDAIYAQADRTLPYSNRPANDRMGTLPVITEHSDAMEKVRIDRGIPLGMLLAGHKKDVLQSAKRGLITIYGWFGDNPKDGEKARRGLGQAIQPCESPHHESHVDYSHGIRFVFDDPPDRED